MTDLVNALYVFAQKYRVGRYLFDDPEYRSAETYAGEWEARLREALPPEHLSWLKALMDNQSVAHSIEVEAAFQAGLAMGLELTSK